MTVDPETTQQVSQSTPYPECEKVARWGDQYRCVTNCQFQQTCTHRFAAARLPGELERLRERLRKAHADCLTMADNPDRTRSGAARLRVKAQGIGLALSYVEEAIRD